MFNEGQIIGIIDNITGSEVTYGTIRMIEPDEEIDGLLWLYIRADNEELNTHQLPNGSGITYWRMIESTSEYIFTGFND